MPDFGSLSVSQILAHTENVEQKQGEYENMPGLFSRCSFIICWCCVAGWHTLEGSITNESLVFVFVCVAISLQLYCLVLFFRYSFFHFSHRFHIARVFRSPRLPLLSTPIRTQCSAMVYRTTKIVFAFIETWNDIVGNYYVLKQCKNTQQQRSLFSACISTL